MYYKRKLPKKAPEESYKKKKLLENGSNKVPFSALDSNEIKL